MAARFLIAMDNLYVVLNNTIDKLPFPLPTVLDPHEVMKGLLKISIGYENRRALEGTTLGGMLFQTGAIPYVIESFIEEALTNLELTFLTIYKLKLHYSNHTFQFLDKDTLVVYEGELKPMNPFAHQTPTSERDLRIWREQQLELEKEAAYASY